MNRIDFDQCFESSIYNVQWTDAQISQLKLDIAAHLEGGAYRWVTEPNPQTSLYELKLKRFEPLPFGFRGRTSNILTDLRNTLDQATSAASEAVNRQPNNRSHFPFGESPDDLENCLSRRKADRCKGIPPSLYDVFRSIQPYQTGDGYAGGNNPLKILSKISGPNKHRITVTVAAKTTDVSLQSARGEPMYIVGGGHILPQREWDDKKGQLVVLALGKGSETDFESSASLSIVFGNSPLKGLSVTGALRAIHDEVAKAVDQVRSEAWKIIGG